MCAGLSVSVNPAFKKLIEIASEKEKEEIDIKLREEPETFFVSSIFGVSNCIDFIDIVRERTKYEKAFVNSLKKCITQENSVDEQFYIDHVLKKRKYSSVTEIDPLEAKKEADIQRNKAEVKRRRREQFKNRSK